MYRIVLTDVSTGMGFCPMQDEVVFETEDIETALLKLSEYKKEYEFSGLEPILEELVIRKVWEKVF